MRVRGPELVMLRLLPGRRRLLVADSHKILTRHHDCEATLGLI